MRVLVLCFTLGFLSLTAHAQTRSVLVKNTPDGIVLADVPDGPLEDGVSAILLSAPDDGARGWVMRSLQPGENPAEVLAHQRDGAEVRAHHQMALALQRDGADRHRIISDYHRARLARQRDVIEILDDDTVGDGEIVEVTDGAEVLGSGQVQDVLTSLRARGERAILRSIEVADAAPRSVRYEVSARLPDALDLDDPLVAAFANDDALRGLEVTETGGATHLDVVFAFDDAEDWKAWMEASAETLRRLDARAEDASLRMKIDVR